MLTNSPCIQIPPNKLKLQHHLKTQGADKQTANHMQIHPQPWGIWRPKYEQHQKRKSKSRLRRQIGIFQQDNEKPHEETDHGGGEKNRSEEKKEEEEEGSTSTSEINIQRTALYHAI